MAVLRDFSRRTSTLSSPTIIINKVQLFTASQGAWLQPGLELSDHLAQLPCVHVLTDAVSYLPRSLDDRRLRRRWPRLDYRLPRTLFCTRCHCRHPLRGSRRRLERGALLQCICSCTMHAHASYRLLTPTNSLRQPPRCTGLKSTPSLARLCPLTASQQAYRLPQRCLSALVSAASR